MKNWNNSNKINNKFFQKWSEILLYIYIYIVKENRRIFKDKEVEEGRKIYGGKEKRECEKNLIFRKSIRLSVELRRANEVVCIFHRARIHFLSSSFYHPDIRPILNFSSTREITVIAVRKKKTRRIQS